jgi:hypothetical protein
MLKRLGMALGAGVASALLFVVTIQGTAIALALAYLAPLPIMIATLGWGIDVGAVALGVSLAVVAAAIEPLSGGLYGLTVALPAWGLAAFSKTRPLDLFRRPADPVPPPRAPVGPSVGAIVVAAAGIGVLLGGGALLAMIVVYGGYQKGVEAVANYLQPAIDEALGDVANLPEGFTPVEVVRVFIKYSPLFITASTTIMFTVNLYAAARSAQLSHRLTRPWPDVPTSLVLPPWLGAFLIAAIAAWLTAPEPASQFAALFVGSLGVVYVMQGLAVLHALSRRARLRPAMILALYLACAVAPKWVLPALAAIGLIESAISLRARAATPKFRT